MKKEIIYKLVKASGVTEGELVLVHFWGEDSDKPIANTFMEAVSALGASPVLLQQSRTVNRDIFTVAKDSCFHERYFAMFGAFDAVLDVFAYQPVILGYDIEKEQFELYRRYMMQIFGALSKLKRFTQIRVPTVANAEESGLEPEEFIARMNEAYDVEYSAIANACKIKIEGLHRIATPVLHTGENCELHFDLTGREWHIDAGQGDLPCGEVYIAPVEDKTWGNVFFEKLFIEDVGGFDHVILSISQGQIKGSNHESVNAFLDSLPESGRIVCELGFGMNPNIRNLCGYTVLDEKMADTFHIAIGANITFGGENDAPNHIDLVGKGHISDRI
jgi:aminopeptidase